MSETVVCLACGGLVDPAPDADPNRPRCRCGPPSSEAATVVCSRCGGSLRVGARSCPHCGSTVATCRCPACLAWNLAGAEHCQACGKTLGAADGDGKPAEALHCPRCTSGLAARRYAELEVEECDQCGGLFLAPIMLDRVVKSRDQPTGIRLALPQRPPFLEHEVRYLGCPLCNKLMNRQAFGRLSGVVVDVCASHGVWFDAGELTQVIQFVERGGLERTREREAEERSEQARSRRSAELASVAWGGSTGERNPEVEMVGSDLGDLAREFVEAIAKLWRR